MFLQLHDKLKQQQQIEQKMSQMGLKLQAAKGIKRSSVQANVVTVNINTNTSVNRCLHGTNAVGGGTETGRAEAG